MSEKFIPTARLRFVKRAHEFQSMDPTMPMQRILQQWWAEDMPSYMRDKALGEWRDVELTEESK